MLASMKEQRSFFSVTGLPSMLLALGGSSLKSCEKYSVARNWWSEMPSLQVVREWPASVLLQQKRVICFGNAKSKFKKDLNLFETIQTSDDP